MDNLAALWRFVRNDPLGRWMGGAWAAVAWCALTWLSLSVALVLVLLTVAMVALQRRRADLAVRRVDPIARRERPRRSHVGRFFPGRRQVKAASLLRDPFGDPKPKCGQADQNHERVKRVRDLELVFASLRNDLLAEQSENNQEVWPIDRIRLAKAPP